MEVEFLHLVFFLTHPKDGVEEGLVGGVEDELVDGLLLADVHVLALGLVGPADGQAEAMSGVGVFLGDDGVHVGDGGGGVAVSRQQRAVWVRPVKLKDRNFLIESHASLEFRFIFINHASGLIMPFERLLKRQSF